MVPRKCLWSAEKKLKNHHDNDIKRNKTEISKRIGDHIPSPLIIFSNLVHLNDNNLFSMRNGEVYMAGLF